LSNLVSIAAGGSIEVNVGSVTITQAHRTEIDQLINGSVQYNENDSALIELFSRHADRLEAIQCRSDLDQLKDESAAEQARQNSKQRLCGFLRKAAQRVGDSAETIAVGALTKYLESLLKGG
jgi:hypothetical protein